MIDQANRTKRTIALFALAVASCSSEPKATHEASPRTTEADVESVGEPTPELLAILSSPAEGSEAEGEPYVVGGFGSEKGEVGIPECDECIRLATECAASQRGGARGVEMLAETKQSRLIWKQAASAARTEATRASLRKGCLERLGTLRKELGTLGCRPAGNVPSQ